MPLLLYYCLAAVAVIISYLRRWRKDCQGLFCLGKSSKTSSAGKRQSFRIWRSGGKEKVDSSRPKDQIFWPTKTASGAGSWHFWYGGCFYNVMVTRPTNHIISTRDHSHDLLTWFRHVTYELHSDIKSSSIPASASWLYPSLSSVLLHLLIITARVVHRLRT